MLFSSEVVGGPIDPFSGCGVYTVLLRPESRGSVMVSSPEPSEPPKITPNYLTASKDRDILLMGFRKTREIMAQPAVRKYIVEEVRPGPECVSDECLLEYLENTGRTSYHPVGTCRMGTDDEAVVDPRLRVNGVQGLRVVDASIMPTLVSGNTNAPHHYDCRKSVRYDYGRRWHITSLPF